MEARLCDPDKALTVIVFLILAYAMLKLLFSGTSRARPASVSAECPACKKAATAKSRTANGPAQSLKGTEDLDEEKEEEDKRKEGDKTKKNRKSLPV